MENALSLPDSNTEIQTLGRQFVAEWRARKK
jgi:hypothetical protein